jgi:FtsZ-interacting cell division protein ZipA
MLDSLNYMMASGLLDGIRPSQTQGRSMLGEYLVEILIVLGVVAVLTLVLVGLIWASRRRKRRRRSSSQSTPVVVKKEFVDLEEDDDGKPRRRRRVKVRYRRRDHRPRNPTLAETGGLPPPRSSDSAPAP